MYLPRLLLLQLPVLLPWLPLTYAASRGDRSERDERILAYPLSIHHESKSKLRTHDLQLASSKGDFSNHLSRAWPPWPFNLLQRSSSPSSSQLPSNSGISSSSSSSSSSASSLGELAIYGTAEAAPYHRYHRPGNDRYRSGAVIAWTFTRDAIRVGVKNVQEVTSNLICHLPPAVPPFLLLSCFPIQDTQRMMGPSGTLEQQTRWIIPLVTNPFCRLAAFTGIGFAIVSWAHSDWHRKRSLTPLPLVYRDIHAAILPPYLPEELPTILSLSTASSSFYRMLSIPRIRRAFLRKHGEQHINNEEEEEDEEDGNIAILPDLDASQRGPISISTRFLKWTRMREERRKVRHNSYRKEIYDQLVALQEIRKRVMPRWSFSENKMGFALVTGASRGIGRAIAVELARWEIPLILLARDFERLVALANDLEACYGVQCCVLQADLSKPYVAESVFNTTQQAGLTVDILVNNAGFSSQGIAMDQPAEEAHQMLLLNTVSASMLTHLYGREMKRRRRGRILMVSSVAGSVAGIPTVALYSATKAFQNSLAVGLAKEMERSGVGVTCVMPGAVRDTDFRSRSKSGEALCWKIPFYTKKPSEIAEMSVQAMLRGDLELMPGWQNRIFVKVLKPILPQRLHNLLAEIAWNPLSSPFRRNLNREPSSEWVPPTNPNIEQDDMSVPRLLQLPDLQEDYDFDIDESSAKGE